MAASDRILRKVEHLKANAEMLTSQLAVLMKELEDGGASTSSPDKGVISDQERKEIMRQLKRKRMKKATGRGGLESNVKSSN